MKRYSTLPITLYRCQTRKSPILREKTFQQAKGNASYDFIIGANKLYNPIEGDIYLGPNGITMKPLSQNII